MLDARTAQAFRRRLLRWAEENGRSFPWRGERDPFKVLVAELLLQRSRGTTVASVYVDLVSRWPTAKDLADAKVGDIASVMRPLGLTRRASTLKALAGLVSQRGMPSVDGLLALPGVGPYVANATAAAACRPACARRRRC